MSCSPEQNASQSITIKLTADGKTTSLSLPSGSTVQQAYDQANITVGSLDRSSPTLPVGLKDGDQVTLVRVVESFENDHLTVPFERQVIRNESMPVGESRLVQPGVNGEQEITYRKVFEDGKETSNSVFKTTTTKETIPEIMMVGVQAPFAPLPIQGQLAYLVAGNAWIMEGNTGSRRPLVTTGDLDGRVFALSPDGNWLLFTRKPAKEDQNIINSLWVVPLAESEGSPIDLKIRNVIHFADWVPLQVRTVAFSTVEPRETAPGWQANNDLQTISFSATGFVNKPKLIVEANSGGIYGWWGTTFVWSPDGRQLAYTRPDGIGLVDLKEGQLLPRLSITPLQTHSDWAWVPGLAWARDGEVLYTVTHPASNGLVTEEESPLFDTSALLLSGGSPLLLAPQSGMFAYPSASPSDANGEFRLAFLQAIFPDQSETSRYRLILMDRDGSNRMAVFPSEGAPGLEPQRLAWSPDALGGNGLAAVIYQENLWLIDIASGEAHQITGDGLVKVIDWK